MPSIIIDYGNVFRLSLPINSLQIKVQNVGEIFWSKSLYKCKGKFRIKIIVRNVRKSSIMKTSTSIIDYQKDKHRLSIIKNVSIDYRLSITEKSS